MVGSLSFKTPFNQFTSQLLFALDIFDMYANCVNYQLQSKAAIH